MVHNHDLDPTCRERLIDGQIRGACLTSGAPGLATTDDPDLGRVERIWQFAYCRWYDHDRAGSKARASAWGWIADRLVTQI